MTGKCELGVAHALEIRTVGQLHLVNSKRVLLEVVPACSCEVAITALERSLSSVGPHVAL